MIQKTNLKVSEIIHSLEVYSKHLNVISGVSWTQREIDLFSCLLNTNSRRRRYVANFLAMALAYYLKVTNILYSKLQLKTRDQYLHALKIIEVNFPKNSAYFEKVTSNISRIPKNTP